MQPSIRSVVSAGVVITALLVSDQASASASVPPSKGRPVRQVAVAKLPRMGLSSSAVDPKRGRIYVSTGNRRVVLYDKKLHRVGETGKLPGTSAKHSVGAIAVDHGTGLAYVVVDGSHDEVVVLRRLSVVATITLSFAGTFDNVAVNQHDDFVYVQGFSAVAAIRGVTLVRTIKVAQAPENQTPEDLVTDDKDGYTYSLNAAVGKSDGSVTVLRRGKLVKTLRVPQTYPRVGAADTRTGNVFVATASKKPVVSVLHKAKLVRSFRYGPAGTGRAQAVAVDPRTGQVAIATESAKIVFVNSRKVLSTVHTTDVADDLTVDPRSGLFVVSGNYLAKRTFHSVLDVYADRHRVERLHLGRYAGPMLLVDVPGRARIVGTETSGKNVRLFQTPRSTVSSVEWASPR